MLEANRALLLVARVQALPALLAPVHVRAAAASLAASPLASLLLAFPLGFLAIGLFLLLHFYDVSLVVRPRLRAGVDERRGIQFGQRREGDGDRDCQSRY